LEKILALQKISAKHRPNSTSQTARQYLPAHSIGLKSAGRKIVKQHFVNPALTR
jgi:hypothetical protein